MADLLWVEPVGGIAGDMFLAAALDVGVSRDDLVRALATIPVGGWRLETEAAEAMGIRGTHARVVVEGPQPPARGLREIVEIIRASGLAPRVREAALDLFERVGRAESRVHGVPIEQCHFHEIGAIDSIVDCCGAAIVLDLLGWPRAVASPPELGQGMVRTAHGMLPVPTPAVLEILAGKPIRPGGPQGEAVTPTGAAILAGLFEIGTAPPLVARRIGYGVGSSRWPDRPNVVRMTLAESAESVPDVAARPGIPGIPGPVIESSSGLLVLEANLDDCPGQLVAHAIAGALERGALDAWAVPVIMKKGRPGVVLSALVAFDRKEAVTRLFFEETTTLGVRFRSVERTELARELVPVETPFGVVRMKVGRLGSEELNAHPEWDDCFIRAKEHGVPVKRVLEAATAAWRSR
jgi:pyridinium-3,5-bisthiocarboxylic acid mononucleotide nickel chelatase